MILKNELFEESLKIIGESIVNDDLTAFEINYKKNIIIDNKKLILFCAQNGAFNILINLIRYYPKELIRLNLSEKRKLTIYILESKYFKEEMKSLFFSFWFSQYKLTSHLRNVLLFEAIKLAKKELLDIFKGDLNILLIQDLIEWTKNNKLTIERQNIIREQLILKMNSKNLFNLLSLSISESNGYCIEIDIFKNLSEDKKNAWFEYLMKSQNLSFHLHQFLLSNNKLKKKNGYNKNDLNIDFLYFFTNEILINQKKIKDKEIKKIEKVIKEIKEVFSIELNNVEKLIEDLINKLEKILLNIKLTKQITIKLVKEPRKNKI